MARRKRRTSTATRVVRIPATRSAAPIIKVSAPRAAPVRHKRRGRRRSGGGGSTIGGLVTQTAVGEFTGGALFGFAVKQGWVAKLPSIPIIGRTGAAALLLGYFARRGGGQMVARAATAAAVIAGYQLGSTGAIMGGHQQYSTAGFDTAGDDEDYDDE